MYASEILKSLVRSERNQQVMCEAGLPGQLLAIGRLALEDETHPIHPPLQYMFERLAAQTLEPRDLRYVLHLWTIIFSLGHAPAHHRYRHRHRHRYCRHLLLLLLMDPVRCHFSLDDVFMAYSSKIYINASLSSRARWAKHPVS